METEKVKPRNPVLAVVLNVLWGIAVGCFPIALIGLIWFPEDPRAMKFLKTDLIVLVFTTAFYWMFCLRDKPEKDDDDQDIMHGGDSVFKSENCP